MADKLFGKLLSDVKRQLGLGHLEKMARMADAPFTLLPTGAIDTLTASGYARKHGASPMKTMPGIAASAARIGERPLGGKQAGIAPRPLFEKRGT